MMAQNFFISDQAARRILVLSQEHAQPGATLRISVTGGGCSGFRYTFAFEDLIQDDDAVFETDGAKVVIDETSLNLLTGAMLDYVEDLVTSSFVIKNPNAASSCGCGNSFSL
jgi:iron-sulfur cluster insertion protein